MNRRSFLTAALPLGLLALRSPTLCIRRMRPDVYQVPNTDYWIRHIEAKLLVALMEAGADWTGNALGHATIPFDACHHAFVLSKCSQNAPFDWLEKAHFIPGVRSVVRNVMQYNAGRVIDCGVKIIPAASRGDIVVVIIAATMPVDVWWKEKESYFRTFQTYTTHGTYAGQTATEGMPEDRLREERGCARQSY
jgi:hypothetical protein